MEIAVAVVMSLDGKLTRHGEPDVKAWAAPEEQQQFRALIIEHDSIVIGSGTYQATKSSLRLEAERLRVVLTSKPQKYAGEAVQDKLEFSSETPEQLINRLESRGHQKLLILGGPQMISDFLQLGVVSKLHVTVEPLLFGQGKPMLADLPVNIQLKLVKHVQLNPSGSLLLTYKVAA